MRNSIKVAYLFKWKLPDNNCLFVLGVTFR